jgi:hypothetical protein
MTKKTLDKSNDCESVISEYEPLQSLRLELRPTVYINKDVNY